MYMHWFLKSQFHLQEKKEVLVQEKKKQLPNWKQSKKNNNHKTDTLGC